MSQRQHPLTRTKKSTRRSSQNDMCATIEKVHTANETRAHASRRQNDISELKFVRLDCGSVEARRHFLFIHFFVVVVR